MNLSSVFTAVAHKKLAAVDLPKLWSNQHELNGVAALREMFGIDKPTRGKLKWHYFADEKDPIDEEGEFTFYDARAKSAARTGRSEWRFYYYGNFLSHTTVGDWLFLVRTEGNKLFALIFQHGSSWLRAAQALFDVQESKGLFDTIAKRKLEERNVEFLQRQIIAELDLEMVFPVPQTDEEIIISRFGDKFPTTKEMSAFARSQVGTDPKDMDEALVHWLDREEQLFLALERVIIQKRLKGGFPKVEEFIDFSLSVHQRRKSRMGFALQNHLTELFDRQKLRFTPQAQTEGKRKPDFIFPGRKEYHNLQFDASLLLMLGAKATCKDRWRQVLVEASRIPKKHLCTLEAGISIDQTNEMREERLTLVVPASLHPTYTRAQLTEILSVRQFVELARSKQMNAH